MGTIVDGLYRPDQLDKATYAFMSICILTPCATHQLPARFCKGVANMMAYSWMNDLAVYQMGITERMVVDWARNDLARTAMKTMNEYTGLPFTHFLWLDDDIMFNQDLAVKLACCEKDMVSALYFGRSSPHYPVAYIQDKSEKYKHYPILEAPRALFECDAVGFGAVLTARTVFEQTPEPWFTIDYRAGEDIAFCVKAREFGTRIWCDGTYRLGHIGIPPVVTEKDWQRTKTQDPERFAVSTKITLEQD